MTDDLRTRLVRRMSDELAERTKHMPDSIPIAVPVGPLADVVIDEMSQGRGVPLVPAYDAEIWVKRRWTEPFVQEEVMEGAAVRSVAVYLEEDTTPPVTVLIAYENDTGKSVTLPLDDAEELALAILSAVTAGRAAN